MTGSTADLGTSRALLDGQASFGSRGPAGAGDGEREVAVGTFGLELRYGRVCEVGHPHAQIPRLHLVLLTPVKQRLSDERPLLRFGVGPSAEVDDRLTVRRLSAEH